MNTAEVERIVVDQGKAAAERQNQLKRMFWIAFGYITIVATVFAIIVWNQSNTINNLSGTLSNRSPILAYIQCHDEYSDARDTAQTRFLLTLLDTGEDQVITPEERRTRAEIRERYERAEMELSAVSAASEDDELCPQLPE